jgi:hypothetical protein
LIVNLSIKNLGYDTFAINSTYFSVVAKDVSYNSSDCQINNPLTNSTIHNGGTATGSIPYAVPATTTDFTLQYTGPGEYNINFTQIQNMG